MSNEFVCWKCGADLINVILPMSRREECSHCCADQHVCKTCVFYDGTGGCNEEQAEHISDKERANFCDYFKPSSQMNSAANKQKSAAAKAQLAALFGDPIPEDITADAALTPAELAEKRLREMLNS